jgi:hypothetical protein
VSDLQTHPDEIQTDAITVDGVRVLFFHHASFNTLTERGYRLHREDTHAERMAFHPKSADPLKPALARRALAEAFVRRADG